MAFALLLAAGGFLAAPSAQATGDATASLSDVPYAVDPGFALTVRRDVIVGGGGVGATAVAELTPGGDVALAGIVGGDVILQRVTSAGSLGTWPAAPPTRPGLVSHASPVAGAMFTAVGDMKVYDGRLYVLADRQRSASVQTNDVYVLVFDLDGYFLSSYLAMGEFRDEHGAGMAIYTTFVLGGSSTTWVSVVGHRVLDAVETNPFLTRARLEGGTTLVRDTSIGDANGYVQIPVPGGMCIPFDEACSMEVAKIAVKPSFALGAVPVIYVGGSIRTQTGGTDWDYAMLCVTRTGNPCSGFGNGGFVRRAFNDGGSRVDRVSGIAVQRSGLIGAETYRVYLTGSVARRCYAGIGIAAFDGGSGAEDLDFGLFGRVLTGGSNGGSGTTPICFLNGGPDVAEGAALANGHLFVPGASVYRDFNGAARSDAQSLVLDTTGAIIDPLRTQGIRFPESYVPPPGPTDSALRSVSTDAAGRFIVAGQANSPDSPYPSAFLGGRIVRDRIFGNGFATPD